MAVQLPQAVSSALNSGDSFLLVTPENVFVWSGSGANESEKLVATSVATNLAATYNGHAGRAIVPVAEGAEPAEFWTTLGGKQPYPTIKETEVVRDARLYSASTSSGSFQVEEVSISFFLPT